MEIYIGGVQSLDAYHVRSIYRPHKSHEISTPQHILSPFPPHDMIPDHSSTDADFSKRDKEFEEEWPYDVMALIVLDEIPHDVRKQTTYRSRTRTPFSTDSLNLFHFPYSQPNPPRQPGLQHLARRLPHQPPQHHRRSPARQRYTCLRRF